MMKRRVVPLDKKGLQPSDLGMVHFKRCPNPECHRPFRMTRMVGHTSGLTNAGKLICPHCSALLLAQDNSIYTSRAMTENEEAGFDSWAPGNVHLH